METAALREKPALDELWIIIFFEPGRYFVGRNLLIGLSKQLHHLVLIDIKDVTQPT